MNKTKLIKLRKENCGYNLENAEDIGEVDQINDFTLFINYEDHTMVFYKEESLKNEIDFIEQYPETYGVIYKNKIYIQGE